MFLCVFDVQTKLCVMTHRLLVWCSLITSQTWPQEEIIKQVQWVLTSVDCGANQTSLIPESIRDAHDSFIDLFVLVMTPGCCVYRLVKKYIVHHLVVPFLCLCLFERQCSLPAYCVRMHHAAIVDRSDCHTLVKMPSSHKGWWEHTRERTHLSINAGGGDPK